MWMTYKLIPQGFYAKLTAIENKNKTMKRFYLISAVCVGILILIIAAAQFGATCTWFLLPNTAKPVLVLLQTASLGAVVGGLLVLWWTFPEPKDEDSIDEKVSSGGTGV
jgi:protein-S-isoprenylcysteine O-methyltransferase Ste14